MRAYLTVNVDENPVREGPLQGVVMPYMTKLGGVPLFTFGGKDSFSPEHEIEALPGMVGIGSNGEMYVVVGDHGIAVPFPCVVMDKARAERLKLLEESFKKEQV